jgi:hypothetical protein
MAAHTSSIPRAVQNFSTVGRPQARPGRGSRLGLPAGLRRLAGPDAVEDDLEPALGHLARVEQLDRARGEVARVGVALLALLVPAALIR